MEKTDPIIELGSTEGDELFKTIRSFMLPVRKGPMENIPVGAIVRLRTATARELFPGKVLPLSLKDPDTYEAIAKFQMVDDSKLYVEINPGDRLELSLSEAMPLMRNFLVKPVKGGTEK